MSRLLRRPRLLLLAVFLLGALLATSGVVVAATVIKSGKAVTAVKVVTEVSGNKIETRDFASPWTDIPGMSLSITVPSSQKALLLITFSAETYCLDGDAYSGNGAYCSIRVLVDGTPALPGQMYFSTAASYEANSLQVVAGPLNAGSHTIKVQGYLSEPWSTFWVGARTLSVLRSRV